MRLDLKIIVTDGTLIMFNGVRRKKKAKARICAENISDRNNKLFLVPYYFRRKQAAFQE